MRIKSSERGLTFSFAEHEQFKVGAHYRYVLDNRSGEIIIIPSEEGKYVFSRKGTAAKPLVDLRNTEVRRFLRDATFVEIEVLDDRIIAKAVKLETNITGLSDVEIYDVVEKSDGITVEISKEELENADGNVYAALKSAGLFSEKTVDDLCYVFDYASLFSGAGFLDVPFAKDPSFNPVFAVDFDKSACESYRSIIGDHIKCMDIRELEASAVPDVELIIGGPCCQGYSNANRAGNVAQDQSKRLLIDDYIRIVLEKKPLVWLIENVAQFLSKENGRYLNKVLSALGTDYNITYSVLTDCELGGYSTRKRMMLIGCVKEMGRIDIPDVVLPYVRTAGDALRKVTPDWHHYNAVTKASAETQRKMAYVRPGHNYRDIPEMSGLDRHSDTYLRLSPDKPAPTITNWRKVNMMPPEGNRILSVSEAEAICGLGNLKLSGTLNDMQQQVGNCVPLSFASYAKSLIKNALYAFVNQRLARAGVVVA